MIDTALEWLHGQSSKMEVLLAELVEISSHTANRDGVDRVVDRLLTAFKPLGGNFEVERRASRSGSFGHHIVGRTLATGPSVLLIGHHDTVFPQNAFSGFREDGERLRGPGVLDMKGGLVVIAFALMALKQADLLRRVPITFCSVSDEEVGSPDGRHELLPLAREANCALVFESGRNGDVIITQRKGTAGLKVIAEGRAAHAGNLHHEGKNAIWALARFVDRAQSLTDYRRGVTINVGRIEGGIGKNTVPDRAAADVDFRFVEAAAGEEILTALAEAARVAAASVPGTTLRIEGGIQRRPFVRTEKGVALLEEYAACARAAGLGEGEAPLLGGGSDANTVAELGVPAIDGLGPRGSGFHTTDEQIERATLIPKCEALVRFLCNRVMPAG
jgi:glutamate carboxypeptidase